MNLEFPHFCTCDNKISKVDLHRIGVKEHGNGTFVSENIECHSVRLAETEPGGVYDTPGILYHRTNGQPF